MLTLSGLVKIGGLGESISLYLKYNVRDRSDGVGGG
jgi:hypothetical protein